MERHTLPIGIQTLREIRRMDCHCVDKTAHVLRLTREALEQFPVALEQLPRRVDRKALPETPRARQEIIFPLPNLP